MPRFPFQLPAWCHFAFATGGAGFVLSVPMRLLVPGLSELLPPPLAFHAGAFAGAALAGAAGWFVFGRTGIWGGVLALLAALVITLLGAEIGSFLVVVVGGQSGFSEPWGLGVLALIVSLESPLPPLIWGVLMLGLHSYAGNMRAAVAANQAFR